MLVAGPEKRISDPAQFRLSPFPDDDQDCGCTQKCEHEPYQQQDHRMILLSASR